MRKTRSLIVKSGQRFAFSKSSVHFGAEFWVENDSMVNHEHTGESVPELHRFIYLKVPVGWDKGKAKEMMGLAIEKIGGLRFPKDLREAQSANNHTIRLLRDGPGKSRDTVLNNHSRMLGNLPSTSRDELFRQNTSANISTKKRGVQINRKTKYSQEFLNRLTAFKRRKTQWKDVMPKIQDDLEKLGLARSTVERRYRGI